MLNNYAGWTHFMRLIHHARKVEIHSATKDELSLSSASVGLSP